MEILGVFESFIAILQNELESTRVNDGCRKHTKVHNRIDQQKEKCCQNVNEYMTGRRGCPRANESAQAGELTKVITIRKWCTRANEGTHESNTLWLQESWKKYTSPNYWTGVKDSDAHESK